MADYCVDADLVKIRPNILSLGVADWDDQRAEATSIINRALTSRWYTMACDNAGLDHRETPFNQDLLLNAATQLTRLGCYKTLELAYLYLITDSPEPDGFERDSKNFGKMYSTELAEVLGGGLDYDWDESGDLAYTEKAIPVMRRLKRC
jgi:hypothetical protein